MATTLQSIAQDLNRSLLHGARRTIESGVTLPSTLLDGRQDATTVDQLVAGLQVVQGVGPVPGAIVIPEAAGITATNAAVTTVLENPDDYFVLEEEMQIPTWIYHQRAFSLPPEPSTEDVMDLDGRKLLRLPAAVLHEAARPDLEAAKPAVSFCCVRTEKARDVSYKKLEPVPREKWQFAISMRCPLKPAWDAAGENVPVFELAGIPENERWYLDQLGLLLDLESSLPAGSKLRLWVERPGKPQSPVQRVEVTEWVIARRNLTGLARPGEMSGASEQAGIYPYAVSEGDQDNTVRLAQMGSITNSGGYFFRPYKLSAGENQFEHGKHTLLLVILLAPAGSEGASGWECPPYANAAIFPRAPKADDPENPVEPTVVRFEGSRHVVVEPYAPAGCLAFGWRRNLPPIADPEQDHLPTSPIGFARSIHLVDYEVKDAAGLIFQWHEQVQWANPVLPGNPVRTTVWRKEPCAGDTGPALSPVKQLPGQTEDNTRIAALALDLPPIPSEDHREAPNPKVHYYRATIRFARDEDGFKYMANPDPELRSLKITAGFRDIFGNRLLRDRGLHSRGLHYVDAVVPPTEWPGFSFGVFPSTAGEVTFEARFQRPEKAVGALGSEWDDLRRKLARIMAQLEGTGNDVAVRLVDRAVTGQFLFTPVAGEANLRAGLIGMLKDAVAGQEKRQAKIRFKVTMTPSAKPRPFLFQPALVVERQDALYHPPATAYPADPVLRQTIKDQVLRTQCDVTLTGQANDSAEPTKGFREIAKAFAVSLAPGFGCQTGFRCNRFNEHELWFTPNAVFPKTRPANPVFSTPRPFSTQLGAQSFPLPDLTTQGTVTKWSDFPQVPTTVTRIDFDVLGRRAFNLLETLASPASVTARTFQQGRLLWADILRGKDELAKLLGEVENNYVVPFFKGTQGTLSEGITRMSQDAFQRDLRLYYGIDALVQWPIEFPTWGDFGITNFYGVSVPKFQPQEPPHPKYSDFVLNVSQDGGANGTSGRVTVTYDLPPGGEKDFSKWKTMGLELKITHLQLKMEGQTERYVFNQGEWLELVGPESNPITTLNYGSAVTVPAVHRLFPLEPTLRSAIAVNAGSGAKTTELARWGWQVEIETEDTDADTLYLEVEYNAPEAPPPDVNLATDSAGELTVSLLHDLVILGRLADRVPEWWKTTSGAVALSTLPALLSHLRGHLTPGVGLQAEPAALPSDKFVLPLQELQNPKYGGDNLVREVKVSEEPIPQGMLRVTIEPPLKDGKPQMPLRLLGPDSRWNFRPNVRLKRNEGLLTGTITNPSLIYECGPVYYPEFVRVANRWPGMVTIPVTDQLPLATALEAVLKEALGSDLNLNEFSVRLEAKHSFKIGPHRPMNAFRIFPVDYRYPSIEDLGSRLSADYRGWLEQSSAAGSLSSLLEPRFLLGVQIAKKDADRGFQRVLLEIDALSFDMQLAVP